MISIGLDSHKGLRSRVGQHSDYEEVEKVAEEIQPDLLRKGEQFVQLNSFPTIDRLSRSQILIMGFYLIENDQCNQAQAEQQPSDPEAKVECIVPDQGN